MKQSILFGLGTALLSLGLAVGGYFMGIRVVENASSSATPLPVFASASSESDGVVLATGEYGAGVEAMFYLDSQSGRLSAALVSRDAPSFIKTFSRNLKVDLLDATKQLNLPVPTAPKFLMVTGENDARQVGSRSGLSKTFVYVAEINSGIVLVYALPGAQNRDLPVSSGTIEFWTFARLNDGLQSTPSSIPVPEEQTQPGQQPTSDESKLIDTGFFRTR